MPASASPRASVVVRTTTGDAGHLELGKDVRESEQGAVRDPLRADITTVCRSDQCAISSRAMRS